MMSFLVTWFSNLFIGELTKGFQIFNAVDCVDQILQRDENPISFTGLILLNAPLLSVVNQILQRFV